MEAWSLSGLLGHTLEVFFFQVCNLTRSATIRAYRVPGFTVVSHHQVTSRPSDVLLSGWVRFRV